MNGFFNHVFITTVKPKREHFTRRRDIATTIIAKVKNNFINLLGLRLFSELAYKGAGVFSKTVNRDNGGFVTIGNVGGDVVNFFASHFESQSVGATEYFNFDFVSGFAAEFFGDIFGGFAIYVFITNFHNTITWLDAGFTGRIVWKCAYYHGVIITKS